MRRNRAAAPVAAFLLVACGSATDPQDVRVLGTIAGYTLADPIIEVPAAAERGVAFAVSVRSYGNGCYRAGDTEVRAVDPFTVEVAPYDFQARAGRVCTDILSASTHTATVRFDAAGPARVRVRGRHARGGADLVVERELLVR